MCWEPCLSVLECGVWFSLLLLSHSSLLVPFALLPKLDPLTPLGPPFGMPSLPPSLRLTLLSRSLSACFSILKIFFYSRDLRTGSATEWSLMWKISFLTSISSLKNSDDLFSSSTPNRCVFTTISQLSTTKPLISPFTFHFHPSKILMTLF